MLDLGFGVLGHWIDDSLCGLQLPSEPNVAQGRPSRSFVTELARFANNADAEVSRALLGSCRGPELDLGYALGFTL